MKFKITSLRADECLQINYFDNLTLEVQDEKGRKNDFLSEANYPQFDTAFTDKDDRSFFHPKKKNLRKLKILIGLKCNFHCKYCPQREEERCLPRQIDSIAFVPEFLKRLEKCIESVDEILFMGGEPFVYIKLLGPLAKGLRKLYPNVRFYTITNASLLDVKMADWCIDNRVNLTLSHDGPSSSVYRDGKNWLEDPACLEGVRRFIDRSAKENLGLKVSVNVVVTPDNCELSALPIYFDRKIGRPVRINFESVVKLNETTADCVSDFNEETANRLISEIFLAGINTNKDNRLLCLTNLARRVVKRIVQGENLIHSQFYCVNARSDTMSVDLLGNLLACQAHSFAKVGYGPMENFATATTDIPIKWSSRDDCRKCPFLVSCLGGCPLQKGKSHEISCKNLKIWHMGLFLAAWYQIFQTTIVGIEPID